MPCAAIRIDVAIRDLRQCQVGSSPLRPAGGSVHGRARQRMAEHHLLLHGQQPVRSVDRGQRDPQPVARALQEQRVAGRLGRRNVPQRIEPFPWLDPRPLEGGANPPSSRVE